MLVSRGLPPVQTSANAASDHQAFRPMSGFRPAGPHVRVDPSHFTAFRVDTGLAIRVGQVIRPPPRKGCARRKSPLDPSLVAQPAGKLFPDPHAATFREPDDRRPQWR